MDFWPNLLATVEIMHVLWFYGFFVSYEPWNSMILMWLYFLLNSGHFSILHAFFGGLCRFLGSKLDPPLFLVDPSFGIPNWVRRTETGFEY